MGTSGNQRDLREMVNAHLFPVLGLVGTVCAVSAAISLTSIGGQAARWNRCYDTGLNYLLKSRPQLKQHAQAIAANFCNGGAPVGKKSGAS